MKKIFFLFLIISGKTLFAQEVTGKKPEYILVVDDSIVTKEKMEFYSKLGLIKAINKGVTQDEKERLSQKIGYDLGEKEFIVLVSLLTEEERIENQKKNKLNQQTTSTQVSRNPNNLKLHEGDYASDFTAHLLNGEEIRLSDLKGKVVLINFWATWCAPCIMEFYDIPGEIIQPFNTSDFVFLPISIGESKEKVMAKMAALKKDGIDFNVAADPEKIIWNQYAAGAIPKNFLIDKEGKIHYTSTGNFNGNLKRIAQKINKLLKE